MKKNGGKKTEPWRMIVGMISLVLIVYMWAKKDIAAIDTAMPKEQVIPLIAATIAVSLIKVAAMAGGILLMKWIAGKIKKK